MQESSQWQASIRSRGLEGEITFGSVAHVVLEILLTAKPELRRTTWIDIVRVCCNTWVQRQQKSCQNPILLGDQKKPSCPPLPFAFGIISLFLSLFLSLSLSQAQQA